MPFLTSAMSVGEILALGKPRVTVAHATQSRTHWRQYEPCNPKDQASTKFSGALTSLRMVLLQVENGLIALCGHEVVQ